MPEKFVAPVIWIMVSFFLGLFLPQVVNGFIAPFFTRKDIPETNTFMIAARVGIGIVLGFSFIWFIVEFWKMAFVPVLN